MENGVYTAAADDDNSIYGENGKAVSDLQFYKQILIFFLEIFWNCF